MRKIALALALALPAAGCATGAYKLVRPEPSPIDPMLAPPPNYSQVCIARPGEAEPEAHLVLQDNSTLVGVTRGGSFFCYFAVPGPHKLVSTVGPQIPARAPIDFSFLALPGGRFFFQQSLAPTAQKLEIVEPPEAKALFDRCTNYVVGEIPGGGKAPDAAPVAFAE